MGVLAAELSTINFVSQLEFTLRTHKQGGSSFELCGSLCLSNIEPHILKFLELFL